jgi:hypothetical protein
MIDYLNDPFEYLQMTLEEMYPDQDFIIRFNSSLEQSCVSYMDKANIYIIELSTKTTIDEALAYAVVSLSRLVDGSDDDTYTYLARRYNEIAMFDYSINGGGFTDKQALKYLGLLNENKVFYTIDKDGSMCFKSQEDVEAARKLIEKV